MSMRPNALSRPLPTRLGHNALALRLGQERPSTCAITFERPSGASVSAPMRSRWMAPSAPAACAPRTTGHMRSLRALLILNGRVRTADTLLSRESFSGWGIRTIA